MAVTPFQLIKDILGAVGFVLPWVELEIVDGGGKPLPPDAEGLIRYRTPQLIENQKAAATPIPFHPGAVKYFAEKGIKLN